MHRERGHSMKMSKSLGFATVLAGLVLGFSAHAGCLELNGDYSCSNGSYDSELSFKTTVLGPSAIFVEYGSAGQGSAVLLADGQPHQGYLDAGQPMEIRGSCVADNRIHFSLVTT